MRSAFLKRHPICNICRSEPASILDHIMPHRGIPALFWDQTNWQGLCVTCHGRKTARETWGRGGPILERGHQ
jgi:5-methylcytosine-specific restriction protein A